MASDEMRVPMSGTVGGVTADLNDAGSIPMADGELAGLIAEFAANMSLSTMTQGVVASAKVNIFDTLTCAVAGSSAPGVEDLVELARSWGGAPSS